MKKRKEKKKRKAVRTLMRTQFTNKKQKEIF